MKKSEKSVVHIALRDIGDENKKLRKDELKGYDYNFESGYDSYILPINMLYTKETRRLNAELGLRNINMKHSK